MSLPETVSRYVDARLAADSAPVWARLSCEDEAAHRMRELLAACFGASVALDDALIAHAPAFVQAQAERWRGMAELVEPPKVQAPEPIVILGPWRQHPSGTWYRLHHGTRVEGATVKHGGWALHRSRPFEAPLWPAIIRGDGGKDEADAEMRKRGWVLLDDMPLCPLGGLGPWQTDARGQRYRTYKHGGSEWCAVFVGSDGWSVCTIPLVHRLDRAAAHGPQTGPEGERLAMAAAYALGFVEGAQ